MSLGVPNLPDRSAITRIETLELVNFLQLEGSDRHYFDELVKEIGLNSLFVYSRNPTMLMVLGKRWKLMGKQNIEEKKDLMGRIGEYCMSVGITVNTNLTFRVVPSDTVIETAQILDGSVSHGGKSPTDSAVGVCVDNGYRISEYLGHYRARCKNIVLFLYDVSKLQSLSQEEIASDTSFAAGYGVKPVEGCTFNDALMGRIVLFGVGMD